MTILNQVESSLYRLVDRVSGARTRPVPPTDLLADCRIVSHRGEHDNLGVMENTLAAFDTASRAGVWGLEFDIRWTRDIRPVVFHDPDLKRLFGVEERIGDHRRSDLEKRFPSIPGLDEVVSRYGKIRHLMIELKNAGGAEPRAWSRALKAALASLRPGTDYHLMALEPEFFLPVDWVPASALLPIGRFNLHAYSRRALNHGYGGVTGHYLLLNNKMITAHHSRGQKVGTGFPASRNVLFREILRGVDWIFSDRAVFLQGIRDEALRRGGRDAPEVMS